MEYKGFGISGYEDDASTTLYGNDILEFSVPKIKIETEKDSIYTGSFDIYVRNDFEISGHICSSDGRMQLPKQSFSGKKLQLPFVYDTTGMGQGDSAGGELSLITDAGEFFLPYEVSVKSRVWKSDLGEIRNLFHFANLARTHWKQAMECFVNPHFFDILVGSGRQYTESYKLLLQYGCETKHMDLAMDCFLVLIHKKQPITFECPQKEYRFERESIPKKLEIKIQKNGWGYADVIIEAHGGIAKAQQHFREEDFEQETACLSVELDAEAVHVGENRTRICRRGIEKPLCEIIVTSKNEGKDSNSARRQENLLKIAMTRFYLDYRTGRKPIKESMKKAEKLLMQFRGVNELLPALYEAHLKLLKGRGNEAIWLLTNIKRMLKEQDASLEVYGYFLYLLSMSGDDRQQKAAKLLDDYAKEHPEIFALYWGCMHKDDLTGSNPAAVYRRLRLYFEAGCTSPVLYMEAAFLLLEKDSVLLSVITDFEIQVLLFMERYSLLSDALIEQIYKAAVSVKRLCPLFLELCQKHPSKDAKATARLLCSLHMKNNCKSPYAAVWLKKGIQSDCRINGLYEAYIRTLRLEPSEILPEEVVRYYAYDTPLEERNLAYVYEKVMKQQEKIDSEYLKRIHLFTINQLRKGKINSSLSYLYRNVLMAEDMDEDMQKKLQRLAFANELTIPDSYSCKSCVIRQKGLKEQARYPIKDHKAVVYLFSDEYTILFEDMQGRICFIGDEYRIQPYLDYTKIKSLLRECQNRDLGEQIYLLHKNPVSSIKDIHAFDEFFHNYIWMQKQEALENQFKKEMAVELIRVYQRWEMHQNAESILDGMSAKDFSPADRAEYILALLSSGLYDKAYDLIQTYGYEKIPVRPLLGICLYRLQRDNNVYDNKILKLAYHVYSKNKFTVEILQYLNLFFEGTIKQMINIFDSAQAMEVMTVELAGRILEQIIFTNQYNMGSTKVFLYYHANGGRRELVAKYLSALADEYLISDKPMEEDAFAVLRQLISDGEGMPQSAGLAMLKYCSSRIDTLTKEEQNMCTALLGECLGNDIYLSFFRAYESIYPVLEIYNEYTYIEYTGKKGQTVLLHYTTEQDGNDEVSYFTEQMDEIYPGIYQKPFRIFWGEKIPYFLTIRVGDQEQFCTNGEIEQIENDIRAARGRFHCINEIFMALGLEDYRKAEELTKKYEAERFMASQMFRLK